MNDRRHAAHAAHILEAAPAALALDHELLLPARTGDTPLHTVNQYIRQRTGLYLLSVTEAADTPWTRARPHWTPFLLSYTDRPPGTRHHTRPLRAAVIVAIRTADPIRGR